MIDIEKVREGLENKILYTRGMFDSHHLGSYYYDVFDVKPIIESITELERLQKKETQFKKMLNDTIESNEVKLKKGYWDKIVYENQILKNVLYMLDWSDEK